MGHRARRAAPRHEPLLHAGAIAADRSDEYLLDLAPPRGPDPRDLRRVNDFPGIFRRWSKAQRPHAGCLIVVGIDHSEYATIIRALAHAFAARPERTDWRDYTAFIPRSG